MLPYQPVLTRRTGAPTILSRALHRWSGRYASLDALTGQTGTLTRAATGTAVDALGTTYTAAHSMPRWESRDTDRDDVREMLGLRLAADDLEWACNWRPQSLTAWVRFAEAGTRTAGGGLLYVGNDGASGARLTLDASSNLYRATIHNGTSGVSVSLTGETPTTDQICDVFVALEDDGTNWRVKLTRIIHGVDTITAWSSTVARVATWGTGAKVRANRVGASGTQGSTWLGDVSIVAGLVTPAEVMTAL